jgi:tRNA (guanine-N7-)-methyltransferase
MPKKKKQEPYPLPHELIPGDWFARLTREEIFNNDKPIEMDLGCGDGSFLIRMAEHFSDRNFLGVERLLGRIRKISRKLSQAELTNAKALRIDSNYAVNELLPHRFASRIHFLCPDPWPKKKHARRRQMCQLRFLKALHSLLEKNGELLFMTDDLPYYEEALEAQKRCDFFEQMTWKEGEFFYPQTDFEEQWLAQGKSMNRLRLRKR